MNSRDKEKHCALWGWENGFSATKESYTIMDYKSKKLVSMERGGKCELCLLVLSNFVRFVVK